MFFWNAFDGLLLTLLAACIVVWPTQWISDRQNRWLRFVAVGLVLIQLLIDGPRLQLLPAYAIAGLFAVLLIPRRTHDEPSALRESRERFVKKLARWTIVGATSLVLFLSVLLCVVFPRFDYPSPTGAYGIGVHTIRLTDKSRPEVDTKDPGDFREVLLRVSYPIVSRETSTLKRDTVTDPVYLAFRYGLLYLWPGESSAGWVPHSLATVRSHGVIDAPAAKETFPVLVYSHGLGSWPEQNTILTEELVSHGYIVVALNHSGLSAEFEREDGVTLGIEALIERSNAAQRTAVSDASRQAQARELSKQLDDPALPVATRARLIKERDAINPGSATADAHRTASSDQRFVLNELPNLQSNDLVLSGRLDLDRIGVFGMSMGGTAAHITCAIDSRCKAGANFDGFQALLLDLEPLVVPFMHMSNERFYNHNVVHEQSKARSYVVRVAGSAHGSYTDIVRTHPSITWFGPIGRSIRGTIDGERMTTITNEYVLAFFNKHLLQEPEPLLDKSNEKYPEVEFLRKPSP